MCCGGMHWLASVVAVCTSPGVKFTQGLLYEGSIMADTRANSGVWVCVQGGVCSEGRVQQIRRQCGVHMGVPVIDRQFLFTVYVHPHKEYAGYQPASPFYGREVGGRIPVRLQPCN